VPRLTLAVSNLNVGYRDALTRSPEWIAGQVERTGFDGIEWNDVPNFHPKSLAYGGLGRWLAAKGRVLSMQQSWQSDSYRDIPARWRTDKEQHGIAQAAKGSLKQAATIALLPRLPDSLDRLERIQRAAGRRLPVIVHPDADGEQRRRLPVIVHPNEQHLGNKRRGQAIDYQAIRESGRFGPLRFQVTAEYLAAIGVPLHDLDETMNALYATTDWRGEFDEIVFDSHHAMMERGGYRLPEPAKMAGRLARDGKLAELQLAWRPDFGGDPQELRSALDGDMADTPQGKVLAEVNRHTPDDAHIYAVIETPAAVLGKDYWGHLGTLAAGIRQSLPRFDHFS
jgi:hypothetical protein